MSSFDLMLPLLLVAALAGLVRGFTGFGSALIFIPLASRFVEPWRAVVLLFIIDGVMALPLVPGALRHCVWREVTPLSIGAVVTVPIGTYFLVSVDPVGLRWALSAMALCAVALLGSGWRYQGQPGPLLSAAVGATSGFLGGLCSFWGPPIVIFWLGGQGRSLTVRANIIVFLAAMSIVSGLALASHGLFTWQIVYESVLLMPAYGFPLWIGTKLFGLASEQVFRRISYGVIAGAAISSVPALDHPSP